MRARRLSWPAAALLAGCGAAEPVELDIEGFDVSAPTPEMTTEAEMAALEIYVPAAPLQDAISQDGVFDLQIFACDSPEGPAETYPVYMGRQPISDLDLEPVRADSNGMARLAAPVPMRVLEMPNRCLRFVGRPGAFSPEVVSAIVPLTRSEAEWRPPAQPPPDLPPGLLLPRTGSGGNGVDDTIVPPPPPPVPT